MSNINLYFEDNVDTDFDFDESAVATSVIEEALHIHGFDDKATVSLYIVSDEEIKEINRDNRNIDKVTDVLSFPNLDFENEGDFSFLDDSNTSMYYDPETEELILGDIVICYNRVLQQAKDYGHSIKREFAFLVAHSILHLLGYDHMEEDERIRMEDKQRAILESLNITRD